jgi:hypothetical protein
MTALPLRRVTAKVPDDQRPVIRVGQGHLLVGLIALEVTGDDARIVGLINVWGHWFGGSPYKAVRRKLHPAAVPEALTPLISLMVAAPAETPETIISYVVEEREPGRDWATAKDAGGDEIMARDALDGLLARKRAAGCALEYRLVKRIARVRDEVIRHG